MRKKYQLKTSDLVFNTLIAVNEKENRRIIDTKDLFEFEELLRKKCSEYGFLLEKEILEDEKRLSSYIYQQGEGSSKKYGLLPWIGVADLYETRLSLPFDLCVIFSIHHPEAKMKKKSKKELESLRKIEDLVISKVITQVQQNQIFLTSGQKKNLALCKIYNRK